MRETPASSHGSRRGLTLSAVIGVALLCGACATTSAPASTVLPESPASTVLRESPASTVGRELALWPVETVDGELVDHSRDRVIPYRVMAPIGLDGSAPVVLVSHGGLGSERGFTTGNHMGHALARKGIVAVHIGHLRSADIGVHLVDRPADVSFVLDQFEANAVALPDGFSAIPDLTRVGHTGHSFGAYTSHAVAGAEFRHGSFVDPRIDAIAPISPQGADGPLGSFDNGGTDHTWESVKVPAFNLVGSREADTNVIRSIETVGWRLQPFARYNAAADRLLVVIQDQGHADMFGRGPDQVKQYIAEAVADFFLVYVAATAGDACSIGNSDSSVTVQLQRRAARENSHLGRC